MKKRGVPIDYKVQDLFDMKEFESETFDFIVDKGTFDAICTDATPVTLEKSRQYLNEEWRVLQGKGGTYLCVSLLQEHVLDALIAFWSKGQSGEHIIEFRIYKVNRLSKEGDFVVFFLQIKKSRIDHSNPKMVELRDKINSSITYVDSADSKPVILTIEEAKERVKKEQLTARFVPRMRELAIG